MRRSTLWTVLLASSVLLIYAIRLTGPTDLEADAQQRNVSYVMDAAWRGNWLAQTEVRDALMSKPPLHTWVAAGFGVLGGINRLTLTLPSALAVLGMTLLVFQVSRRRFGELAGVLAGMACVLAPIMSRHIALVRTDALFAFAIALTAFAALRAWERRDGWLLFWLAAAAATLVKGPLGLLLGAAGLLAFFWERRTDPSTVVPQGRQATGIFLFFGITLGWLLLAVNSHGYALIDKLFFEELFGQMTGMRKDITPGENLYKPALFFLIRFAPFSLFAAYGLWRIVQRPAQDAAERRFERFLFVWIMAGMLMFTLGAHFRADLLLPLWPPAAVLAGREMARLGQRIGLRTLAAGSAAVSIALLALVYWHYHPKAWKSSEIQYSVEADRAGAALAASGIPPGLIHHLDTPPLLLTHLGVYQPWVKEQEALRLAIGSVPACLAMSSREKYPVLQDEAKGVLREVFRMPPVVVVCNAAFVQSSRHDG